MFDTVKELMNKSAELISWYKGFSVQGIADMSDNKNVVTNVLIKKILEEQDILQSAFTALEARLNKLESANKKKESKDKEENNKPL